MKITLIPGDGIGPEIVDAMRYCVDALNAGIEWDVQEAGAKIMEKEGTPLPESVLDSIRANKVAIKGPITTPVGEGFRSVNVSIRKALDLYQNIRPAKTYNGVPALLDLDLVIFRENTDDLYAGIEFEKGNKKTREVIEFLNLNSEEQISYDSGIGIKPISEMKSERIARAAFEYASKNGRKKVTAVHKANIMKFTDGLFLETVRKVSSNYESIKFDDRIVDNMCMQLVTRPGDYDVLVLPNLYGDIVSDLCAGLMGGIGIAPGANIGDNAAVFEAVHGSAPKYAGKNRINPTALILSAVMMLRHIGKNDSADILESAVAEVLKEGKSVTYDLNPKHSVGTKEMAEAIRKKIRDMH